MVIRSQQFAPFAQFYGNAKPNLLLLQLNSPTFRGKLKNLFD